MSFGVNDVHILCSESAAGSLAEAYGIDHQDMLLNADDLTCGPLSAVQDDNRWRQLRSDYWRGFEANFDLHPRDAESPAPTALYDAVTAQSRRLEEAESIILWLGSTALEQLLIAWLVAVFTARGIGTTNLRLLEIGQTPLFRERSIGALSGKLVRSCCSLRNPQPGELESYRNAWDAVSRSTPERWVGLCGCEDLPKNLHDALMAFLARFPDQRDGLNHWDRALLRNCKVDRLKAARIVGQTFGDIEDHPDWPSDFYLFHRLLQLARRSDGSPLPTPLVEVFGSGRSMRHTEVTITEAGRGVLSGGENFVTLNGVEDWIGGVKISSVEDSLWFFDGTTLVKG